MFKKFICILCSYVLCLSLLPAYAEETEDDTPKTQITFTESAINIDGDGAIEESGTLYIRSAGSYLLSGSSANAHIIIEAAKEDEINLTFSGVQLSNETLTVIEATSCGKLTIKLKKGTINTIISGTEGVQSTNTDTTDDSDTAALFLKCDTVIKGDGSLTVQGLIQQGIRVTKDLQIKNGNINITAATVGIRVKDDLTITGGKITITAGGDGIRCGEEAETAADNSTETKAADGSFVMEDGTLDISSGNDGIQSENTLTVLGGSISIVSGGGQTNATAKQTEFWGRGGGGWDMSNYSSQTGEESTKGLKSAGDMSIEGGSISINSCDDALHTAGNLHLIGGSLSIATGDDGMHSDTAIVIDGGIVDITASYEGIEAPQITVNDGTIALVSSDDGFNASDGSSETMGFGGGFGGGWGGSFGGGKGGMVGGKGGFGGPGGFGGGMGGQDSGNATDATSSATQTDSSLPSLTINGGNIYVNADGDGLDSNGDLTVNGGTVIVDGPDNSANGALDSGSESGGVLSISGGTVLAIGASGMAENFSSASAQASLSANISFSSGDVISIADSNGNVLLTHTAAKSGNSIVFSCPQISIGDTLRVTVNSKTYDVTVSQSNNSSYGWGGGWGR